MVIDPATLAILTAIKAAQAGYGAYKEAKMSKKRAKQAEKETYGDLFSSALDRSADEQRERLSSSARRSRRRTKGSQDTSDLLRGALGL